MELKRQDLRFRVTTQEDAPYLTEWLSDPKILPWFPMTDAREIEDCVRILMGCAKIGAMFTVECNGEPCAMANLYIQPFQKLAHTCLFAIIVSEQMRGKGIGSALMEYLMDQAKNTFHIETLHLEVYEGNPAIHLYERLGFTTFGIQTRFVKEEGGYRGRILMQKKL